MTSFSSPHNQLLHSDGFTAREFNCYENDKLFNIVFTLLFVVFVGFVIFLKMQQTSVFMGQ